MRKIRKDTDNAQFRALVSFKQNVAKWPDEFKSAVADIEAASASGYKAEPFDIDGPREGTALIYCNKSVRLCATFQRRKFQHTSVFYWKWMCEGIAVVASPDKYEAILALNPFVNCDIEFADEYVRKLKTIERIQPFKLRGMGEGFIDFKLNGNLCESSKLAKAIFALREQSLRADDELPENPETPSRVRKSKDYLAKIQAELKSTKGYVFNW